MTIKQIYRELLRSKFLEKKTKQLEIDREREEHQEECRTALRVSKINLVLGTDHYKTYGGGGGRSTKKILAQGKIK